MNLRLLGLASLLLLGVMPVSGAHRHVSKRVKTSEAEYVLALAAANRFLSAWQTGDLETGALLLSDRARRSRTAESLETLFARGADRAFEISRGKADRGCYRFPVVMVSGENNRVRRKFSEFILVNTGKNDWVVDQLP